MAEVEQTGKPEHPRHVVKLAPGERVALCRCFASQKFPFCDGTHNQMEGKGPAIVEAPQPAEPQ